MQQPRVLHAAAGLAQAVHTAHRLENRRRSPPWLLEGKSSRIIATILETTEALEQHSLHRAGSNISNNAAHKCFGDQWLCRQVRTPASEKALRIF